MIRFLQGRVDKKTAVLHARALAGLLIVAVVLVSLAYQTRETVRVDIGKNDAGYIQGFSQSENDGEQTYRWTNGNGSIILPGLGQAAPLSLLLRLTAFRPDHPGDVTLWVNGERLAHFKNGGWETYQFDLANPSRLNPDLFNLEIVSDTWSPAKQLPGSEDHRTLGVAVDFVELMPATGSPTGASLLEFITIPALCPILLTAILSATIYLLLLVVGLPFVPRVICGVLASLGVSAGIATSRLATVISLPSLLFVTLALLAIAGASAWSLAYWSSATKAPRAPVPGRRTRLLQLWRNYRVDLALALTIFLGALIIRWWDFFLIPPFGDEITDIRWAFAIASGQMGLLLAVPNALYVGSLHMYLLAAVMRLFGSSAELPRTYVVVMGALTAPLTYGLARSMGGRVAGLIAGGLMATVAAHVIVDSHIAWPMCTTPVFVTAALWSLHAALKRQSVGLFALAGFLLGLALQMHVLVICAFVALGLWFCFQPRVLLRLARPLLLACLPACLGSLRQHGGLHRAKPLRRAIRRQRCTVRLFRDAERADLPG